MAGERTRATILFSSLIPHFKLSNYQDGFTAFDPERLHGQHPEYGEAGVLAVMRDLLIEDAEKLERRTAGARRTAAVITRYL